MTILQKNVELGLLSLCSAIRANVVSVNRNPRIKKIQQKETHTPKNPSKMFKKNPVGFLRKLME